MEVIILAGGLGTRLQSVVADVPKCMAPVCGKPFLWYLLRYLQHYPVNKLILSVGYLRQVIMDWIEANRAEFPFSSIDYAIEDEPLGTGGAIKLALSKTTGTDVVVLNGDTFFDIDLNAFIENHRVAAAAISIALKPMVEFDRYGTVSVNEKRRIESFNEKKYCRSGLINGGVYAINKSACDLSRFPEKCSFETDILQPFVHDRRLYGFVCDDYFIDIGIPADYHRAEVDFNSLFLIEQTGFNDIETLFLDRDGVINKLRPDDYVKSWEEFEFTPGILDALARWNRRFKYIIIVTNQRGVGKGVMTTDDLEAIHQKMVQIIEAHGGRIDRIYCCTATSDADPNRKPNPGMAQQAKLDFPDIDFQKSIMIGDSESDILFAKNVGMKGIKKQTGICEL